MNRNTPGPLGYREGSSPHYQAQIYDNKGKTVAISYNDEGGYNAQRLTACWNACDGINPEAVNELLEALRRVEGFMADMAKDIDGGNYPVSFLSVHNAVVSAIAKAEGRE